MTRRDNGHGIATVGGADRANGSGVADLSGDIAVRPRLPEWNRLERLPDLPLKRRPDRFERKFELCPPTGEILIELLPGVDKDRVAGVLAIGAYLDASGT